MVIRGQCEQPKLVAAGKVLAVAKNRPKRSGHRPQRRFASGNVFADAELFELIVKPIAQTGIGVSVGEKGPIFKLI